MQTRGLAPHEAMEVHELLTFKTACVGKAATMRGMVQDPQLRSLLDEDINSGTKQIRELQGLVQGIANQGR